MISRKHILSKTHYGIHIYGYILKQHFPEEEIVLSVNNCDCKPVNNPFLPQYRGSLKISVVNGSGVYQDLKDKSFKGDVFDFAQLYFKTITQDELLIRINDVLHLGLESKVSDYDTRLEQINHALDTIPDQEWNPRFSYFSKNLYNLYATKTVGIYETYKMITDPIRKYRTDTIRKLVTEEEQKKYKKSYFDFVTFSGTFTQRNNTSLIKYSELLTVDIDNIDSANNLQKIKVELLEDSYFPTELLFTSPRGKGLKWIIKISLEEVTHLEYFRAVSNYLKLAYNIQVDVSGSDVSRACLLSYDPEAYINPKYIL
ncbi:BT4734/BF3469 family protein [Aquimarina sp. MMG016]|uniref:BT4734/BF3469 family protein n=1 Tax=Aquimarina sp. MMG016 TaxID=2822690 RepID=UPI001B39EA54|nr:BT4734/BF3469 family protein [Aquimarina sp. MMG016]MBQ4820576.1 VirE protein [Aquimarina sp. MMG016]